MPDFEQILRIASQDLPAAGVRPILIGGFAVNHYGYTRNTLDVDFMVPEESQTVVRDVMFRHGFMNRTEMDNVVFYRHPAGGMRVDFLTVDKATYDGLLVNAKSEMIGNAPILLPALGDLLAMKIFALAQGNMARKAKDLPDIAFLCVFNGVDLEETIKPLCEKYGCDSLFEEIRQNVEWIEHEA